MLFVKVISLVLGSVFGVFFIHFHYPSIRFPSVVFSSSNRQVLSSGLEMMAVS